MNVLVTGAAGFIGKHLLDRLRKEPDLDVYAADVAPLAGMHAADLTQAADAARLVGNVRFDVIYHLAGATSGDAPTMLATNVLGVVNVLEAVKASCPDCRTVVMGSAAEYGNPMGEDVLREDDPCHAVGMYGISKHLGTLAALDYARTIDVVVARPFNLIGTGMNGRLAAGSMIRRVLAAEESGELVKVGDLTLVRDFIAVQDLADALVRIATHGRTGRVYNVCSGVGVSMAQLVGYLLGKTDVRMEVDTSLFRAEDPRVVVGSRSLIGNDCNWQPVTTWQAALDGAWDEEVEARK